MSASVNEGPAEPAIADGCPSFEGLSDEECCRICLRRLGETLIDVLTPDDSPTELELAEWEAQAAGRGVEFRAELDKRQREQDEEEARQRERELAELAKKETLKKRDRELADQAQQETERKHMRSNDTIEEKREAAMAETIDHILRL